MNLGKRKSFLLTSLFLMAFLCVFAFARPASAAETLVKDGDSVKVINYNSSSEAIYYTETTAGAKTYNFQLSKGGTLTLDYIYLESTYPSVRIYNASGSEMSPVNSTSSTSLLNDDTTAETRFKYYYLPKGSYKLYVEPYTSGGTTYAIIFQLKYAPASGKLKSGKVSLCGSQSSSSFSYYKVTAKKAGYINVKLGDATGMSTYPSFDVKLMTAKKKKISEAEYVGSSQGYETTFAVKKGTYYIAVKSRISHPIFHIKATVKAVSVSKSGASRKKAGILKKGGTVKGLIYTSKKKNSATQWYKFVVPKTQKVSIVVRTKPSQGGTNGKLKLTFMSQSGKSLEDRFYYNHTGDTLNYYNYSSNKLTRGTYWLGVSGENHGSGYYALKWKK